jgi:predicted RNA-binding protein YlqC (UPF0109 family)
MSRALIEYIAKALADEPELVEVAQPADELIELHVSDSDRGKLIGRRGRTVHAIRTLLAAAYRDKNVPTLEVVD